MNSNLLSGKNIHNPDVLSCLANLSNDEVFTPPELVNKLLDMLPQKLFENPNITFLDPCCKSGVFLREIAKRLIKGLEKKIPNLEKRVEHIFKKQLYGISITRITALLSRRSVYCSKFANKSFSVVQFENPEGNIRFENIKHEWKNGKCIYCGASKEQYDRGENLENHAYEWIHVEDPEEIFNMKFDVIVGNPPYQMNDGGNGSSAIPLYHLFVQQAKKLNPRYLSMIIPARWFSGGKGLDEFRNEMIHDKSIRYLCDFFDSTECFPGVDLSGGVCYFLWDRDYNGDCWVSSYRFGIENKLFRPLLEEGLSSFVRFNEGIGILKKIRIKKEPLLINSISSRKPFGIPTSIHPSKHSTKDCKIKIYAYPYNGYINHTDVVTNFQWVGLYKVYIAKAYGERGEFPYMVIGKPFLGEPNSCCSETYLVCHPTSNINEAKNCITYLKTKFARFLILLTKNTQNAAKNVYQFVPMQDFSKPWTDAELYKKYKLTQDEIDFIESMIRPMSLEEGGLDE